MYAYSTEEQEMVNAIIELIGEEIPFEEALFAYYEINGEGSSLY